MDIEAKYFSLGLDEKGVRLTFGREEQVVNVLLSAPLCKIMTFVIVRAVKGYEGEAGSHDLPEQILSGLAIDLQEWKDFWNGKPS